MEKIQIKNTAGMFDLLKGVTMMLVVFEHTIQDLGVSRDGTALQILGIVMVALFISSGYGFRKKPVKKAFEQQAKLILLPYAITAFFICIGHAAIRWFVWHSKRVAVIETLKVFAGLVLGLSDTIVIKGVQLFSCGPMWYLLALFWGWMILDFILSYAPEKWHIIIVLLISIVGVFLSYIKISVFGVGRGMFALMYLYIGYYCKKHKLFTSEWSTAFKIIFTVFLVAIMAGFILLPGLRFPLLLLSMSLFIVAPVVFMKIFLLLNHFFTGSISNKIRTLGRYSLYFLCVHSFEYTSVPWYVIGEKVNGIITFIFVWVIRFSLDVLLCAVVVKYAPVIKDIISKKYSKIKG